MISETEIDGLLAATDNLFFNIYTFDCDRHAFPGKSHRGAAIAFQDTLERRTDFIRELRNTMCSWVYSKKKYQSILSDELRTRNHDYQNAISNIQSMVGEKFRKSHPQGQFGELILFNFIQHLFRAAPLLRKMPITTNAAVERHGADAIHFRPINGDNTLFLGEAKTYSSKYKFKEAIETSVDSVLTTFSNISSELGLYIYEDFIDESLRDIAKHIKYNTLPRIVYDLVCVVGYLETSSRDGLSQSQIQDKIESIVTSRLQAHQADLANRDQSALRKIHFIVLPFWNLDELLKEFQG